MKTNIRKVLLVCAISPLLMAVLCEKVEELPPLIYNKTNVTLSEGPNFSINDTLWISGMVSSMLFDEGIQDSIRNPNESIGDIVSVLRLKSANRTSNTTEAINEFELISRVGSIDFLGVCPESELIVNAPLTVDGRNYRYEIGLVPKNMGDFVLGWLDPVNLKNNELHLQILANYPIDGDTDQLGLTKCGITSTRLDVKAARNEYFFSVE